MASRVFVMLVFVGLFFIGAAVLNAQEAIRDGLKLRAAIHQLRVAQSFKIQSDARQECPRVFSESGTSSPAKSWGIQSADGQALAWSVAVLQKEPEVVRGQVLLRNERTGQRETVFETQTKAGTIISTDRQFANPTYNIFCVVDWSPDSHYLLLQEILGRNYSDVWNDSYWIYNRMRRQRQLVDLKPLKQAIEKYWQKKLVDFRDIRYQALAVGWEGGKSNRVVFMAFTYHEEASRFLGIWSVAPAGKEPRLLTDKEDGLIVGRFGKIVDPPE